MVVSRGGEGSSRGRELVAVVSRAVVTVVSWQSWAWTLGALKQDNTKKEHDKKRPPVVSRETGRGRGLQS